VERAPTVSIPGVKRRHRGVLVTQLADYPVRGLVFEGASLDDVAEVVGTACQRLVAANVPHNLFIADCGARVFLLPNCFAERKVGLRTRGGGGGCFLAQRVGCFVVGSLRMQRVLLGAARVRMLGRPWGRLRQTSRWPADKFACMYVVCVLESEKPWLVLGKQARCGSPS
jgi:hypothetical protein